jgi:hypothetical protein
MWNWNPGNTTTITAGDWFLLPNNALHFKSFDNLGDGCIDLMSWLSGQNPSKTNLLAFADAGDLAGFQNALQTSCYAGCVAYPSLQNIVTSLQATVPTPYSAPGGTLLSYLTEAAIANPLAASFVLATATIFAVNVIHPRTLPRWARTSTYA